MKRPEKTIKNSASNPCATMRLDGISLISLAPPGSSDWGRSRSTRVCSNGLHFSGPAGAGHPAGPWRAGGFADPPAATSCCQVGWCGEADPPVRRKHQPRLWKIMGISLGWFDRMSLRSDRDVLGSPVVGHGTRRMSRDVSLDTDCQRTPTEGKTQGVDDGWLLLGGTIFLSLAT